MLELGALGTKPLTAQELQSRGSQAQARVEEMELSWLLSLAGSPLAGPARGDRERPVKGLKVQGALVRGKSRRAAWEDAPNFLHCSNLPLCSPPQRSALVLPESLCAWPTSVPAADHEICLSVLSLRPCLPQTRSSP